MQSPARRYLEVVLPELDGCFHYHLPSPLARNKFQAGMRLLVPFGKGYKVAYFIRSIDRPEVSRTKAVIALLDPVSLFLPKLFQMICWIAQYYQTPLGGILKAALPRGIHVVPRRKIRLTLKGKTANWEKRTPFQRDIYKQLFKEGISSDQDLRKRLGSKSLSRTLSDLKKKDLIADEWEITPAPTQAKFQQIVVLKIPKDEGLDLARSLQKRAPRQAETIQALILAGGRLPTKDFDPSSRAAIKTLIQKNIFEQQKTTLLRRPTQGKGFRAKGDITLSHNQKLVFDEINTAITAKIFAPFLLHGVTGSGKTEVYLRAIEAVLAKGNGAILLLPEIGLTTHIAARFQEYFGDAVALLHSGLSAGERYDEWRRVAEGDAKLVIGARSAIFAPLKSVGIIIIDEEHDASYRQSEGSRYHGRDVALVRGRNEKAVVILGSATPSFESYFNSQNGKYCYLNLPDRIDSRPLPKVRLVNLKEKSDWIRPFFTKTLHDALKERIAKKEQSLLFVNRRGFSPFLLCNDCGYTPVCEHCSVSLTYHKRSKQLICHYCAYQKTPPSCCPDCQGTHLNYMGIGTEQIEETISTLFPDARVARLDRDSTQKKGAYDKILGAMEREEIDILIGTQMIAKGHDFPKVTLVGVLSADLSLHVPDFRSSERTFQLLTQVAGRAGRGERPGEVIVQTFQIENPSIQAAAAHDYENFYLSHIGERKERIYPPFSRLTLLLVRHRKEEIAASSALLLAEAIGKTLQNTGLKVLGPAPASLLRLKEEYRYQILLKGKNQKVISSVLVGAIKNWRRLSSTGVRLDIEVDPQQFV